MWTELHWINTPWPGKIAVSARPRGGDWLRDEVASWKRAGINAVVSLLTPEEETDLDLKEEGSEVTAQSLGFLSLPIPDRQVPKSEARVSELLDKLAANLSHGQNAVIHCRQGIGRSGLIAAALLVKGGTSSGAAIEAVSMARGVTVPETPEQKDWIEQFAAKFGTARGLVR